MLVLPALLAAAAMAAPEAPSRGLVVVLSPETKDDVTRNAMARIRGELGAAPFAVVNQSLDSHGELMAQVETAGRDQSPVAAFAIVREPSESPSSVSVWVSNRITRTTTVHRVVVREGDVDGAAAALAIEAVELVRASMAGLWPTETKPPSDDGSHPAAPQR